MSSYQNSRQLLIKGKRWYFGLVPRKEGDGKKSRALMEDFGINDLVNHLVICYTPAMINGKPFRKPIKASGDPTQPVKEAGPGHIFALFDDYLEFFHYYNSFPLRDRNFYEIVFGEFAQKPHFDIDIKLDELEMSYPGSDIDVVAETVRDAVINGCRTVLENMGEAYKLNIEKDLLLYSSHTDKKRSYHIVINNKCHDSNIEARAFYEAVIKCVSSITNEKYISFVDCAVYNKRQQFRTWGSQKVERGQPKEFHQTFDFKGVRYEHKYCEEIISPEHERLVVLRESLVGFTNGCISLPSLVPQKVITTTYDNRFILDEVSIAECLAMLKHVMKPCPFSFKEVNEHVIVLKRESASMCPMCERVHQNENPFLFVINNKVYWDCRRSNIGVKKFFVGYIGVALTDIMKNGGDDSGGQDNSEEAYGDDDTVEFGGGWGPTNKQVGTVTVPVIATVPTPSPPKAQVQPTLPAVLPLEQRTSGPAAAIELQRALARNSYYKKEYSEQVLHIPMV
jgi:hypothetical protein